MVIGNILSDIKVTTLQKDTVSFYAKAKFKDIQNCETI